MTTIALLTERRYAVAQAAPDDWYLQNILQDDRLLIDALAVRGVEAARVDWSDSTVDWRSFEAAVFRTTWDYFDRPLEFARWLDHVERLLPLVNPAPLVRWNADKHYLLDLQARGVRIVPTLALEPLDPVPLADLLAAQGWDQAVVKPSVSGAARHTYRVDRHSAPAIDERIGELRKAESFLVQPFQAAIVGAGECSLMVFDGRCTHAVRKVAKPGDFRVQDDHGGTVHAHSATAEEIEFAERAVAAVRPSPAYARVDVLRDNEGLLALMELELIEPELWLRRHPPAATALADAVLAKLQERPSTP